MSSPASVGVPRSRRPDFRGSPGHSGGTAPESHRIPLLALRPIMSQGYRPSGTEEHEQANDDQVQPVADVLQPYLPDQTGA
ncbi:hypothetical protein GCM10022197_21270 [Microlunatus spumicola]|uniref:Uncharacterized protein n=1 Tax=Microlunatus spumicola TaxID=81499 RepID=A0ABP6XEZ5_9ACTN